MPRITCLSVAAFLSLLATSRAVRSQDMVQELTRMDTDHHEADALQQHTRGNSSALESMGHVEFAARSGHTAQAQLGTGHVLNGQYELKRFLGRFDAQGRDLMPPKLGKFPAISSFASAKKHLGTGSFGDTWLAHDKVRDKDVAVKIFFVGDHYLTPGFVKASGLEDEVAAAAHECDQVIAIMKDSAIYAEGAKHICDCYEAHTEDDNPDGPLYLVQEMCGDSFFELFAMAITQPASMKIQHPTLAKDTKWAVKAIAGTLEGIEFLSKLGYIHHDLKLENVVVREDAVAKIIDFGGLMTMEKAKTHGGTCTPSYTPKEVTCGVPPAVALDAPVSSFDDYSVGIMLFEVLCKHREETYFRDQRSCGPGQIVRAPSGVTPADAQAALKLAKKLTHPKPSSRPAPAEAATELRKLMGIKK